MPVERSSITPSAQILVYNSAGEVLLMRRFQTGWRDGELDTPAGHVDKGESPVTAARRELFEESGLGVKESDLDFTCVLYENRPEVGHDRVYFFFTASRWTGDPEIREPKKCSEILWADPFNLPEDTLAHVRQVITRSTPRIYYIECGWKT